MTRHRSRASALVLAVLAVTSMAAVSVVFSGAAAYGSCAAESRPSANAFTGEVVSVTADGKVATVRTDNGSTVEVIGGPGDGSVTSVDRTYKVGVRYEFHPVNNHSPYQDNICTATHVVNADSYQPNQPDRADSDGTGVRPNENTTSGALTKSPGEPSETLGQPSPTTWAVVGIAVLGMVGSYLLFKHRSVSAA